MGLGIGDKLKKGLTEQAEEKSEELKGQTQEKAEEAKGEIQKKDQEMHISNPSTFVPLCYTKKSFC